MLSVSSVKEFIASGENINRERLFSNQNVPTTILMDVCSIINGDEALECVQLLIKAGANVNYSTVEQRNTALIMASGNAVLFKSVELLKHINLFPVVEELLKAKADIKHCSIDGYNALETARFLNERLGVTQNYRILEEMFEKYNRIKCRSIVRPFRLVRKDVPMLV
jgi:ankyrin repeat protein